MALRSVEIYCDFDGTISKPDSFDYLLSKLADPLWEQVEARWEAGEISARECMSTQTQLIKGGWQAVAAVLDTIEVDPTFPQFVRWCKATGRTLYVVSDGLDRVIEYVLAKAGLTVDGIWANHLVEDEVTGGFLLQSPFAAPDCPQGVCKCQLLTRTPSDILKVVIGDGRSDFCWASGADLLFAKSKLLQHCLDNNIDHIPFDDFASISSVVEERCHGDISAYSVKNYALLG